MAIELSTITFSFLGDVVPLSGADQLVNTGMADTFAGNDILIGTGSTFGINNAIGASIQMGNGNDTIISTGVIYNGGSIKTGSGNDFIIANQGFEGLGSVSLGDGDDYIKSFGSGNFSGGNGNDILELPPGSYTFVNWFGAGKYLKKGNTSMGVGGFEQLVAGSTTYNFSSLTQGQIIIV